MTTQSTNIYINQGATNVVQFQWLDPLTNLPISLQGWRVSMEVKEDINTDFPIIIYSTMSGAISLIPASGILNITVSPGDFEGQDIGNYWYDIFFYRIADNYTIRFARGFITVLQQVTDAPDYLIAGTAICSSQAQGTLH